MHVGAGSVGTRPAARGAWLDLRPQGRPAARPWRLGGALVSELIETYRGAVFPWHCDHMGHMNVMWYVGKFDEATWNLFAAIGMTPAMLREQGRAMAAVQQNIGYRRELYAGDVVAVRSGILEVRDKVVRFVHEMRNG